MLPYAKEWLKQRRQRQIDRVARHIGYSKKAVVEDGARAQLARYQVQRFGLPKGDTMADYYVTTRTTSTGGTSTVVTGGVSTATFMPLEETSIPIEDASIKPGSFTKTSTLKPATKSTAKNGDVLVKWSVEKHLFEFYVFYTSLGGVWVLTDHGTTSSAPHYLLKPETTIHFDKQERGSGMSDTTSAKPALSKDPPPWTEERMEIYHGLVAKLEKFEKMFGLAEMETEQPDLLLALRDRVERLELYFENAA